LAFVIGRLLNKARHPKLTRAEPKIHVRTRFTFVTRTHSCFNINMKRAHDSRGESDPDPKRARRKSPAKAPAEAAAEAEREDAKEPSSEIKETFGCIKSGLKRFVRTETAFGAFLAKRLDYLARFVSSLAPQLSLAAHQSLADWYARQPHQPPAFGKHATQWFSDLINALKADETQFASLKAKAEKPQADQKEAVRKTRGLIPLPVLCSVATVRTGQTLRWNTVYTISTTNELRSQYLTMCRNFASSQYMRVVRRHIRYVLDPPTAAEDKTGARGRRTKRKRDLAREWRMLNELLDLKPGAKLCDTARDALKVELSADQKAWLGKYRAYVPESMRGKTFFGLQKCLGNRADVWMKLTPLMAAFQRETDSNPAMKKFALVPQYGQAPRHAILSRTALIDAYRAFRHECKDNAWPDATAKTSFDDLMPVWKQTFRTRPGRLARLRMLHTDGVSLVQCLSRPDRVLDPMKPGPGAQPKDTKATYKAKLDTIGALSRFWRMGATPVRVIAVDPGVRSVFTTAEFRSPAIPREAKARSLLSGHLAHQIKDAHVASRTLANGEWHRMLSTEALNRKLQKQMRLHHVDKFVHAPFASPDEKKGAVDEQKGCVRSATAKTQNRASLLAYLARWHAEHPALQAYYFASQWRVLSLLRYTKMQQHLALVSQRLLGEQGANETVVVAFGDGTFSSTMKGHRSAPVRKLRNYLCVLAKQPRSNLRVLHMPEHRTSKLCSTCNLPMRAWDGRGNPEQEDQKRWAAQQSAFKAREAELNARIEGREKRMARKYRSYEHAYRACSACHRCWDRDVNSAKNMLLHTMALLYQTEVPKAFWPDF
jgi:hypothetical protein